MDNFGRYYNKDTNAFSVIEHSPRIEQPENVVIPLTSYQKACISSMAAMEIQKTCIPIAKPNERVISSTGILSNKMGSGKTATIIGLISYSPIPDNDRTEIIPLTDTIRHIFKPHKLAASYVKKIFTKVLKQTVIFVGSSVLYQWQNEIEKFNPSLKVFIIPNILKLKQFNDYLSSGVFENHYDIILVKNGNVTGVWNWPGDKELRSFHVKAKRSMYNMFGAICADRCFARVVIDDFDTIDMPTIVSKINCLFTWHVSSTNKTLKKDETVFSTMKYPHCFHVTCTDLNRLQRDKHINNIFNVNVSDEFYHDAKMSGIPSYWKYPQPSYRTFQNMLNLGDGDTNALILEAIQADAIGTAAALAGIEAKTPNDIFRHLLQKEYDAFIESRDIIELYDNIDYKTLLPVPKDVQVITLTEMINTRQPIIYKHPGIEDRITNLVKIHKERIESYNNRLTKARDDLKENECVPCNCPLIDEDDPESLAILPCCGRMIHASCAVGGCRFVRNGNRVMGRCPFDKSHIVELAKMVYLNANFTFDNIDANTIDIKEPINEDDNKGDIAYPSLHYGDKPRMEIIADVIKGINVKQRVPHLFQHSKVMTSFTSLGQPKYEKFLIGFPDDIEKSVYAEIMRYYVPRATPRVLIFSKFIEISKKLTTLLKREGCKYSVLSGTPRIMSEIVETFTKGEIDILVVNSEKNCSSLNLQTATDLIFAHDINQTETIVQILGRIQRFGRSCDSRIHMLY